MPPACGGCGGCGRCLRLPGAGAAVGVVVAFVLDIAACVGLFLSAKHFEPDGNAQAVDVLVSCALRLVVLPACGFVAYALHARTARLSSPNLLRDEQRLPQARPDGDLAEPLHQQGSSSAPGEEAESADLPNSAAASVSSNVSRFEAQRHHALTMQKAENRKMVILGLGFVITTAMSMHNGLKAVGFTYSAQGQALQGTLFGVAMVMMNFEYFLLRAVVEQATKEVGELIPSLHMHPLFFELGLKCHQCDICCESMKGPHYIAYRCRTCDFDLCPRCYRKKDDPNARGFGARAVRRDGEQLTTWTFFKRIVALTLEFKWTAALAVFGMAGTQAMQIWAPNVTGRIFDAIDNYWKDPKTSDMGPFETAMVLYLGVCVFQGAFNGLRSLCQELVLRQLAFSVRVKLFHSVIRMDISFFDTMHTGQLTSRLTNDASQMVQPLNTILNDLIANLILLVGGMAMAFHTSWKLSMLALTVVPPISFCYRQYAKWGRKINRSMYCAYGEANGIATEAIHNIRTVRGFSTERHETDMYENNIGTALSHGRKNAFVGASVSAFSTYLNLGTAVLILWYGGGLVMEGKGMSLGNLITYQLYWNMMNGAFISLSNVFNDLIRSSSAAERVLSLIDARPEVDPDDGDEVGEVSGHLQLRAVEFRYKSRPENKVLKGVDLNMTPGTVTALVGKSGGGKSTLVHLLMRFYEPTGGNLLLDGRDMRELSSRSVRTNCGFVAQDTQLFAKSIEENLAYGLGRPYTKEEMVEACVAANAHEFIMETEDQYDTRVGERGMMLSGGQRQRLAIARCFLRRPRLLFLDEATSALDAENEAVVQQALDTLIEKVGCTVVLIAHRLCTVINATQIAVVHKGSVIERGTHDELIKQGGIYAKLVDRQMSRDAGSVAGEKKARTSKGKDGGKAMQTEIDELIEDMEVSGALPA